jgi:hypothetical protein
MVTTSSTASPFSLVTTFKGLFNDTTLMQIQSGRTVPLSFLGRIKKLREKTMRERIFPLKLYTKVILLAYRREVAKRAKNGIVL